MWDVRMLNIVSGPSLAPDITRLVRPVSANQRPVWDRSDQSEAELGSQPPGGEELVIQKLVMVKSSVTTLGTYCPRFHNTPMLQWAHNAALLRGEQFYIQPLIDQPLSTWSMWRWQKSNSLYVLWCCNLKHFNEWKQKPSAGSLKWLHKACDAPHLATSDLFWTENDCL